MKTSKHLEADNCDVCGPLSNPHVWCESCCQWCPAGPNAIHTCYDKIKQLVECAIPARFWRKRRILYTEIYRISLRKDVYRDF